MALVKPVLQGVPAWDVNNGQTFVFDVVGGDIVVGNTLYILNNETGEMVYSLYTESYKYEAIVPSGVVTLENGKYYSAYVVTHNAAGYQSNPSNIIQFHCYTNPQWYFTNVYSGAIIPNSFINASVQYFQLEEEHLLNYVFNLYDEGRNLVSTSGVKIVEEELSTVVVSHIFGGLENISAYYIQCVGNTVNNTVIDTGLIGFTVRYEEIETAEILQLENNCEEGYVSYFCAFEIIIGNPKDPVIYTPTGVDLLNNRVDFEFEPNMEADEFVLKAKLRMTDNVEDTQHTVRLICPRVGPFIPYFKQTNFFVGVRHYPEDDSKIYAYAVVQNMITHVFGFIYDEPQDFVANGLYTVTLEKVGNYFNIKMENNT